MSTTIESATAIRPFRAGSPDEAFEDLPPPSCGDAVAREGNGRRWFAGCSTRDDEGAGALLGRRLRPPEIREEAERLPAVHDRDRRPRHHFIHITMTWVTKTGVSSGRLYWENTLGFFDLKGVKVPAAVSVFPRGLYQAPRSWAEQAYPNLIYFNEVDRATTSQRGRSRICSQPRRGPRSGHSVEPAGARCSSTARLRRSRAETA
jgi:hypothetical protein